MAAPVVTVTPDKATPYSPGESITLSWTAVDPDTGTVTIHYEGEDSEGNAVSGDITINRQDVFTMTSVSWVGGGPAFSVNNTARTATSVVPSA